MSSFRTSRQRYQAFVEDYRHHRIDEQDENHKTAELGRKGHPYVREYLSWLRPQSHAILAVFGLVLIVAVLQMLEPLFMRFIVDRVLLNPHLDQNSRFRLLNGSGALFFCFVIISNLLTGLREYRQQLVTSRITLSLRRALFERFLHLPMPKLWEMKTGGILSRITGDLDTTASLFALGVVTPTVSVIRIVGVICILTALNRRLALSALAVIPGLMVSSFISIRRVRPIYRSVQKDASEIEGRLGETFSGIRVVRAFRREACELLEFLRGHHTAVRKEMFAEKRRTAVLVAWNLLLSLVNVTIVWFGGYLNLQRGASIGDIMAFQMYMLMFLTPIWNIVNTFSELQRSLAAMERVFEALGMEDDKPDRPDCCDAPHMFREICFEGVEFEYRKGHPVVHDFNVTVRGGSVIALVGRSGAGKTTITDLVARFHDPTKGRILVDNVDIRDFRLRSYRRLLAVVPQGVFLFAGSVKDNIAYGRRDATDAEVENAARLANAHEFIEKLPEQYDTHIGERGVKLSGGQQQRLSIARAILASPQILILDEATSNLDTESEQLIQMGITNLVAGRTTFIIAHRLSTVRRADLILVIEDGRIIERGTDAELMAARGAYHDMVMGQMKWHSLDREVVLP
jgi:ATP-binding cassette subfamily B protein